MFPTPSPRFATAPVAEDHPAGGEAVLPLPLYHSGSGVRGGGRGVRGGGRGVCGGGQTGAAPPMLQPLPPVTRVDVSLVEFC